MYMYNCRLLLPPVRGTAMFVLSVVTSLRLMRLKFSEQARLLAYTIVPFEALIIVANMPTALFVCLWVLVCTVLPLIGLHTSERKRLRAFALNVATM